MKAFVVEKPHQIAIKDVPYPSPKKGEITIKVNTVGICGTDRSIYNGSYISTYPIIPGHEFSGTVNEVGEDVTDFKIGDRVTAEPNKSCYKCENCRTGKINLCTNMESLGVTYDGAMAEYVVVPADLVVKLSDKMDFATGAFIEPVACVVHAVNRLKIKAGDRVLLFGAGATGQLLIQSLSKMGVSKLAVVDISKLKLDLALKHGATEIIESKNINNATYKTESYQFDIVIDATGNSYVIEQALSFMGDASKYLQFGVTSPEESIQINSFDLFNKEWSILGSKSIHNSFIPAFRLLSEQRMDVKSIISKTISLDEIVDFFNNDIDTDLLKVQLKL